ncbi:division/cell wall cluster transcriptional repressor MraZ [Patescibacteria group bacterium]|nr:division/cell wall cluster transcriptional repressor MraZ [Patescibacteria group bacterium]
MFLGEYQQKLTGKGRVLLPAKMRQQVQGDEIVLSKGFEKCLFGFSKNQWEKSTQEQITSSSVTQLNSRDLRRYIFSGAAVTTLDTQGRFIISHNLSEYAGVKQDVTIIGAGDHFEIWEPVEWKKKLKQIEEESSNT